MEARRIKREFHLLLPIVFFLFFTFSFQAAVSSPISDKDNAEETKKKAVLEELVKVVGRPNITAAGGDYGAWMAKSVEFILEKMNWKYNFSGGDGQDPKRIEEATMKIVVAVSWIVTDPELNPYRSLTKGITSFAYLFKYVRDLEKNIVYGGDENPVYQCFKGFWPTCEVRAPATLEGAVVYRFECGWEFYEKCQLQKWAQDGRWHVPDFNKLPPRSTKPN